MPPFHRSSLKALALGLLGRYDFGVWEFFGEIPALGPLLETWRDRFSIHVRLESTAFKDSLSLISDLVGEDRNAEAREVIEACTERWGSDYELVRLGTLNNLCEPRPFEGEVVEEDGETRV